MKPDIELCAELLNALLQTATYKSVPKVEVLSGFLHNFKFTAAYERQVAWESITGFSSPFRRLVDQLEIRERLAELDPLVPMAAMIVGFRNMDDRQAKTHDSKADDLKELQARVSRLDTGFEGIGTVASKVDTLSATVRQLETTVSALTRTPTLTRDVVRQRRTMLAIGAFAFVLTLAMIVYGFYWGIQHGDPEISIDLDIGQLVGGTLLGTGALLAGGAYALATLRRLKSGD